MEAFFGDVDLLLTPTLPVTAFAGRPRPARRGGRAAHRVPVLDGLHLPVQRLRPAGRLRALRDAATACRWACRSSAGVAPTRWCCAPRGRSSGCNRGRTTASIWYQPADGRWPTASETSPAPSACSRPAPRNSITDVPGVLVGHSQAGSGEPTGVTVVAPPRLPGARGRGDHERRRRADQEARDRRVGDRPDGDLPVRHPRAGHRLPRRDPGRGRRSVEHADPGGGGVRRLRPGRRPHGHRRGRRRRPRGARRGRARRAASAAAPA